MTVYSCIIIMPRLAGGVIMREEYIQQIAELLHKCKDISLLDLIYQLLQKSEDT